jgi:polysaccharide chain length determinant protein (PEP-CTERM system associated)
MHDIFNQLLSHARAMWRYHWIALAATWLICLAGWFHVAQMPNEYRSSARVHIDTDSILRPLLRGLAVEANVTQRIQLMTRTLLSQPNLEKLARMTDMHLAAQNQAELEQVTDRMRSRISIGSEARQPNLFNISYRDTDPKKAQEVVQALLTIFMETTLGKSREDSDSAQRFLDQQIQEYEQRLSDAESRRADFRRTNVGMLPSDQGGYYQRLQSVESQIEQTRLQMREAENRRVELNRQLEREKPVLEAQTGSSVWDSPLRVDSRIDALQQQLDALLLRFTENHPDVIALRNTIGDLQAQRDEELALRAEAMASFEGLGGGASGNPLYQQLRILISNADAELASLRVRLAEFERQRDQLRRMVDTIPQIEAEMQRLDRDYEVNRSQYEELLKRRETAQISQVAEDQGENVQFRIIDPARMPREADGPNRPLYFTAVLALGLGIGIGLAFLVSQLRPVFDNRRVLTEVTGFPVLGTVSLMLSPAQQARSRTELAGFAAATVVLLMVWTGIVMLAPATHSLVTRFI